MSGLANHPDDSIPVKECICKYCCPLHLQKAREEITALRARLQKQGEALRAIRRVLAPFQGSGLSLVEIKNRMARSVVKAAEIADIALSQTPSIVHSETEEKTE